MTSKILMVDDETHVLAAHKRGLGKRFDIHTALSGGEGLNILERDGPFAVVVSDMRMPGMDGVQFLAQVKKRAPDTVRIMLTGHPDLRMAISAVNDGNIFRFHTKPCPVDDLAKSVEEGIAQHRRQTAIASEISRLTGERAQIDEQLRAATVKAEIASRRAEDNWARIKSVVNTVIDGIVIIDEQGIIDSFNPAAERLFGYTVGEVVGKNVSVLMPEPHRSGHDTYIRSYLDGGRSKVIGTRTEQQVVRKDGTTLPAELSISETKIGDKHMFTGIVRDISGRKKAEETIRKLALNDSLTGLPNRNLFHHRLEEAFRVAARLDRTVALMLLDLDQFKRVNDTFGHPTGDALLKKVARRIKSSVRQIDTVARLGGDEFAVIINNLENTDSINVFATRIIKSLSKPFTIDGDAVHTGTSVGISFYPFDGTDPEQLIRNADLALYRAKAEGRNTYHLYEEAMYAEVRARNILQEDMRRALDQGEFLLHYQPQLSIVEWRIVGAEALIRWRHPERGMVPPDEFIPATESSGFVVPIGTWALWTACTQNKAWQDAGLPPFRVAVNISPRHFQGEDLVRTVEKILTETGLDPWWLDLEITEGIAMDDANHVIDKLARLSDLGINLTIDDFGTGYSSLTYLKRFPVHKLKVDRSFVKNLTTDPDDAAITEAVIKLGHSLNLKVIAEGIESEEQLAYLRSMGCEEFQGYHFCRPLPADDFARWVTAQSPVEAVKEA